jgi:alkyl sulfatase BDS1-like metallo-beta-lactamase superfamily hydrolase
MLDPARAEGLDHHLAFRFAEGETVGLHLRNGISAVTDGLSATATITLAYADLVRVLAGPETLGSLLATGAATIAGDAAAARAGLACFDVAGFAA